MWQPNMELTMEQQFALRQRLDAIDTANDRQCREMLRDLLPLAMRWESIMGQAVKEIARLQMDNFMNEKKQ